MTFISTFICSLKNRGMSKSLRLIGPRCRALILSFVEDRRRGVSTARRELAGKDSARHGYVATDYTTFQAAMRHVDVRREDVFVDFGSGKGRTLILAADFPFRRIIGVEFDKNLNDLALKNLQRALPAERLNDIELIVADATSWRIPDDATVLFSFNPFRGEVLAKVCANIRRSLAEAPRKITIIYVRPDQYFEKETDWQAWLTRKREIPASKARLRFTRATPRPCPKGECKHKLEFSSTALVRESGRAPSRPRTSGCIYGCDTARSSRCLRRP